MRIEGGSVRARFVVVACNGYLGLLERQVAAHVMPINSYIIATEELPHYAIDKFFPGRRMISDTRRVLNYFRPSPYGNRILWGGRASFSPTEPEKAAPALRQMMLAVFPELKDVQITHAWTGNVAFTFDFLPHIGVQDGIHYAAGCQGSGVAMATWLGNLNAARSAGARMRVLSRFRPSLLKPVIALIEGLTDPVCGLNMGQTAEVVARRFDISRAQMDAYAARSHLRLHAAREEGRLAEIERRLSTTISLPWAMPASGRRCNRSRPPTAIV